MKTFGQILAQCRKENKLTQKQVAERLQNEHGLCVKVASLSQWEKDQHLPNVKQFFALCRIYQISEIGRVFGVTSPQDPISHLNEEGKQMTEFNFYLSDADTERLFAIKELQGRDDLTGNEFARMLLEEELYRLEAMYKKIKREMIEED